MRLGTPGSRRTSRASLAVLMVAAIAGGGVAGCASSPGAARTPASHRGDGTAPTTTAPRPAVTLSVRALVDDTRPVVSGGEDLSAERALPTSVWTPAGPGPFPLVVFVPGFDKGPLDYQRFCAALASSGFVVAAPSFPQEDPARGFPLDESHLGDEAADVSFVIASLTGGTTADKVDRSEVAVVGHSDGADVALLVGYGQGTVDGRVAAVVADAPDPMTVGVVPSRTPLLLVQGTADSVVPYSASQTVFGQVGAPVSYVTLIGADHLAPIAGGTPWTPVLDGDVAAFLDATVADRGPGTAALAATLAASPLVRYASKG